MATKKMDSSGYTAVVTGTYTENCTVNLTLEFGIRLIGINQTRTPQEP